MSLHIYEQVAMSLEEKIAQNIYGTEGRLPSERELAKDYQVSRMTIRQAIGGLVEKGIITRERGRGTYINKHSIAQNNVKSFTETVADMGFRVTTQVLELSTIFSLEAIAQQLDLHKASEFFKVKRLRRGNEVPMALETLYIPKIFCPDLDLHNLEASLYKLLEEVYSLKVKKVSYKMEATLSNPIQTKLFNLNKPIALLKVSGITYSENDVKLFYEESYYRSDLYNYQVDIHRKF